MSSSRLKALGFTLLLLFISVISYSQDTQENAEFRLALSLYNDKMYDLALEQLKRFVDAYPNTQQGVQARYYLGLTQMALRKYADARVTFQSFALSYPDNPQASDAWWNVAQSYVEMKNYAEAASAFERLKVFHPKSKRAPDALLQSAVYFRRTGVTEKVKQVLRTLIQEYPTSDVVPDARLVLAETYSDEGNLEQARAELSRVIGRASSPDSKAKALLLTGEIYQRQEKLEAAEKAYREVIQSYANTNSTTEASYRLGLLHQQYGRYLESISSFKRVLADTSPTSTNLRQNALVGISRSYFQLKDYPNALLNLTQLFNQSLSPEVSHEARLLSASSHEALREYQRQLEDFRAITLDTTSAVDKRVGYVGAARVSRSLKDFEGAISYLRSLLAAYPDDPNTPEVLYALGDIYANDLAGIGTEKNAVSHYQTILTRFPRSPLVDDALFSIGRVHEKSKDAEQALNTYRELIGRYPASSFAAQAKERIRRITTFHPTPSSESLSKLAQLLASLISGESKGESAFHLGEIYLNDLKDFDAAGKMFASAIQNRVPEPNLAEAFFYRARAYHLLAERNRSPADTAVRAYEEFLDRYPKHEHSAEAAAQTALLRISQAGQADPVKIAEDFVLKYPASTLGDVVIVAAGDSMQARGRHDRATLAFEQLLAWFPSSPLREEALFRLGFSLQQLGKNDSAQIIFSSYLEKYPDGSHGAELLSTLAKQALNSGKPKEAMDLYRSLMQRFSYTPQAMSAEFDLCRAYAAAQQPDSAIARCLALLQEQREDLFGKQDTLEAFYLLGSLYEQKAMRPQAKRYFLAYLRLDRTSDRAASALFRLSHLYRAGGNLETAISFLSQSIDIVPERDRKMDLAQLLFDTGDYAGANTQFADLARSAASEGEKRSLDSKTIIGLIRLGNLPEADGRIKEFSRAYRDVEEQLAEIELERGLYYFRKQDYTSALSSFEKLTKDYDETRPVPSARYWIGKIYEATGQTQKAVEKYDEILKKYPGAEILSRVYLALGNIDYRAERFDPAVKCYQMIVDSISAPPDILQSAMNNLVEAYKTVGLFEAALQLTRKFIEKYPDDESVQDKRIDIGVLYEKLGYHDQSIMYLQSLLEEVDADLEAEVRYSIGEAHFGKGDYDRAILEFLKVPYLVTEKGRVDWIPNAFYMSGQAYEKMGKYDQAISMYRQIIERSGIDQTFKAAAQKEIDRVNVLMNKPAKQSGQ